MKNVVLAVILATSLMSVLAALKVTDGLPKNRLRPAGDNIVKIAAVGDIMLGRAVGQTIASRGSDYPLQAIRPFLRNFDFSTGNLEGAVLADYSYDPSNGMRFSFSPRSVEPFSADNFIVLSLANNHALDFGGDGFMETKTQLQTLGISPIGHPDIISKGIVTSIDAKNRRFTFIGLNRLSPNFSAEEAVRLVNKARSDEPDAVIIILIHWGNEYETRSRPAEQKLGRDLVEAGAKIVLGAHPHVIQEIEKYRQGIIFYSLGNFIFDQNFSAETRQGLLIGLEFRDDKLFTGLFPIVIAEGQAKIAPPAVRQKIFDRLAIESRGILANDLKSGIIPVDY